MQENNFRRGKVFFNEQEAGIIEETQTGYRFTYSDESIRDNQPISVSFPIKQKVFETPELFPFFIGLLPEGWYLELVSTTLKIDKGDCFGILLATCKDTVGAVSIYEIK